MNGPPLPPMPPDGHDNLDEALNALVDGELEAFAREHGLDAGAVQAQLATLPDFEARRAELVRARAAVGASVPPLDEVTRQRLLRNARAAEPEIVTRASRSRRWLAVTAIAASGLLVVAGIGIAVSSMGGGSSNDSSERASSTGTAPLRGDVGALGDVTSAAALRALLDRRASAADGAATTTPRSAQPGVASGGAGYRSETAAPATTAACAAQLAGGRTIVFTGTGTYQGAPVTIVGISTGGRTIVFVVADADCTNVLASISR